jgi:hypothetical protein
MTKRAVVKAVANAAEITGTKRQEWQEPEPFPEAPASDDTNSDETLTLSADKINELIDLAIKALPEDPGAIFEPAVLQALNHVKQQSAAEYVRLRKRIKSANKAVRLRDLDLLVKTSGPGQAESSSGSDRLVELIRARSELFHDLDLNAYISIRITDSKTKKTRVENWPIKGSNFESLLGHIAYTELDVTLGESVLKNTVNTLTGIARFAGSEHEVFLRAAKLDDRYYIDLCNADWQVVEITPAGWQVLDNSPVKFRRTDAMRALPLPAQQGDISPLWSVTNVPEDNRPLYVAWMLESFRPDTPFPLMELNGDQGTGKSDTHDNSRELVDPSRVNLRSAPKNVEDIYVGAANNWVISFNNLSRLSAAQQDALCTLATGGGFSARTLFANDQETLIEAKRPVILNGIATLATAQDLVDRTIKFDLPSLKTRRSAAALKEEFDRHKPTIFAGILDLFVKTLAELPQVVIDNPPRMADFVHLGEAMFRAQGKPAGEFLKLYRANQQRAIEQTLDASPVAVALQKYVDARKEGFEGTVKTLRDDLRHYRDDADSWPRSVRGFADTLRRAAPGLRMVGVEVRFDPIRRRDGYYVSVVRNAIRDKNSEPRHLHAVQSTPVDSDQLPDTDFEVL